MYSLLRSVGVLLLVAAALVSVPLFAQETSGNENVIVVGSGLITPVLEAAAATAGVPVTLEVTGSQRGLEAFCQGQADVAAASRSLNESESVTCASTGVEFIELLLGYQIAAFVAHPESTFDRCLTDDQIQTLFAPSSAGQIVDWSQVNTENTPAPIALVLPDAGPLPDLLDRLVTGEGLRADGMRVDPGALVETVATTPNSIGLVDLPAALAAGDSLRILELNISPAGCTAPSAEAVDAGTYSAALPLYVYVNASAWQRPSVVDLLNAVFSDAIWNDPAAATFSQPPDAIAATNRDTIATGRTGRVFSAEENAFTIPAGVSGTVNVAGSATAADFFNASTSALTSQYPGITVTTTINGQVAGVRRLCNGEVDLALTFSDLTAEQAENCAANNISLFTLDLGRRAVVLVAHAGSSYLQCLTVPQIVTAFSAESAGTIMNWSQVDPAFPETPMTLFTPQPGSVLTDLIMLAGGVTLPTRIDVQLSDDAAYRAAATANVEGGLAVLSWAEYQDVLARDQQNIMPVSVDSGSGCVEPSFATIADSSYALSRPARLLVNTASLTRPEVQSVLWYLISDENFPQFADAELIGVTFASLADLRANLQAAFTDAAAAAALAPEVTPEAAPDDESASAAEPTLETTPEATPSS
ncbi:MAG: substrate-binding domain-containing protein [Anaerolinea sp.]|nr:substrate-binding domain-containing protein [Anaerolinea sp.]